MNNRKFHGITSLVLVLFATLLGLVTIALASWGWALLYLGAMLVVPQILLRAFCSKCPCKERCAHILPGKAAVAFARKPGPYTPAELLTLVGTMLVLVGMPQIWLWQMPVLMVAFWALMAVAVTQIRLAICPTCNNTFCPLRARAAV